MRWSIVSINDLPIQESDRISDRQIRECFRSCGQVQMITSVEARPNPKQAIANLTHAVQSLAAVDAKQILVVNLPDLGICQQRETNNRLLFCLSPVK